MKELNVLSTLDGFGHRELAQAISLLTAYAEADHLPSQWANRMVTLDFNPHSGMVFLTNDEYQALVLDDETSELALWYSTPYNGYEGTLPELCQQWLDMDCHKDSEGFLHLDDELSWHIHDIEYLHNEAQEALRAQDFADLDRAIVIKNAVDTTAKAIERHDRADKQLTLDY